MRGQSSSRLKRVNIKLVDWRIPEKVFVSTELGKSL